MQTYDEQNDECNARTNEKWNLLMDATLAKDKTRSNLINVYRENRNDTVKFERINQAFTYGIKLKNGQPEPEKLY